MGNSTTSQQLNEPNVHNKCDVKASILQEAIRNLNPSYFALVMATGIVSIAAFLLHYKMFAWVLFGINMPAYVSLWGLTIIRLFKYPQAFFYDLTSHSRGPGFFTTVAGTCVLGSQFVILFAMRAAAFYLYLIGGVLWLLLTYIFFTAVTIKAEKPALENGIHGAWLITIVATQSVSILGVLVFQNPNPWQEVLYFTSLALFLVGCMLYIFLITLIIYRFVFFKITPKELTQPYWINMGAVAITTLAGSTLILNREHFYLLQDLLPFLKGFTLFFWAIGTWWIPLLFILGYWRHIVKKFSFRYDPQYWGMVFPLGMYTVCTFQLSHAINWPALQRIPDYFIFIAMAAWAATSVGMLYSIFLDFTSKYTREKPSGESSD